MPTMVHEIIYLSAKIRICGEMDGYEAVEVHYYCSDDCITKDVAGLFMQDWMPHPSRANLLIGMANELVDGHVYVARVITNAFDPDEFECHFRCEHCAKLVST